jgi:hypothetical protein
MVSFIAVRENEGDQNPVVKGICRRESKTAPKRRALPASREAAAV